MTTFTRAQIEAMVEALHVDMIAQDDDGAIAAMDALIGTGTPASEEYAERLRGDYVCALADGTVVEWGGDVVLAPGIIGRDIVFVAPADQLA